MFSKYLLFTISLLFSITCIAQNQEKPTDSTSMTTDVEIEKLSDKVEAEVKNRFQKEYEIDEKKLLGTFILTQDKVDYTMETNKKEDKKKEHKTQIASDSFNIKSVKIDIREGVIFDIRVLGELNSKTVVFTNRGPINMNSLINHETILRYKIQEITDDFKKIYRIRLQDFLGYDYENGQLYIIDNELVELNPEDKKRAKVFGNGTLKSLIDFRIYSDFLGLINESANGIVSFEGNSTFFLNPFSIGGYNYIFKKLNSSVRYSRFDDNDQNISLPITDTLDLIQKSFINVSGEIDLFETRFSKRYPYKMHLKTKLGLDITKTKEEGAEEDSNTTTLNLGFGAGIQIQRFSNFGLNSTLYFNRYENGNLFENQTLNFNTLELNTEVYFYDSKDSNDNDAFFLRLAYEQGIGDLSSGSNFFNFQLGYKAQLNFNPKK